jgi:hypothetical protein
MKEVDAIIAQSPEIHRASVLQKTSFKDHNLTRAYRMVAATDWLQPMLTQNNCHCKMDTTHSNSKQIAEVSLAHSRTPSLAGSTLSCPHPMH